MRDHQYKYAVYIKIMVFLLSWLVIWFHIRSRSSLLHDGADLIAGINNKEGYKHIAIIILLMLINWSLEAVKWQFLLIKIQPVSFIKSLRAVFNGVTVSFYTPNRIGEFAGRVLHLNEGKRLQGSMATFVGSSAQLLITLQAGVLALLIHGSDFINNKYLNFYLYISILIIIFLSLIWFRMAHLSVFLQRIRLLRNYKWMTSVFEKFNWKDLIFTYVLSFLRFLVFCSQQYLLYKLFNASLGYLNCLILSSISFLFITLIPSIALGELGLRGSVNLSVFSAAVTNPTIILIVTFFLWMINLALPAIIGAASFFFISIKEKINILR